MYDHMNGQHDYPELDQLTILSQTRMLQRVGQLHS